MNGWPATAARVSRSFWRCSTCLSLMTSTLRSILSAKTLSLSCGAGLESFESQTRAKVPVPRVLRRSKSEIRNWWEGAPNFLLRGSFAMFSGERGALFSSKAATNCFSLSPWALSYGCACKRLEAALLLCVSRPSRLRTPLCIVAAAAAILVAGGLSSDQHFGGIGTFG